VRHQQRGKHWVSFCKSNRLLPLLAFFSMWTSEPQIPTALIATRTQPLPGASAKGGQEAVAAIAVAATGIMSLSAARRLARQREWLDPQVIDAMQHGCGVFSRHSVSKFVSGVSVCPNIGVIQLRLSRPCQIA
jgi:hypothetical protein